MKMKKMISAFLVVVMVAMVFSTVAFASDYEICGYPNAAGNINAERLLESIIENSKFAINGIAIEDAPISADATLVSQIDYDDGSSKSIYDAEINIGIVFDETINADGTVSAVPKTIYTKTESSDYNFSSDIEITCTITYETGSMLEGGSYVNYVKLTKVSASYRPKNSQCSLSNKKVRGRYKGYDLSNSRFVNYTSPWYASTSATISGKPLENTPGGMSGFIYGDAGCTVSRGDQMWELVFTVAQTDFAI